MPPRFDRSRVLRFAAVASIAAVCAAVAPTGASPAGASPVHAKPSGAFPSGAKAITFRTLSATGSVTVQVKGNGHGHGMSQYGARGAAGAGYSARTIVGFYYPGTTLTTLPTTWIRVLLSGYGGTTTVGATTHLTVAGIAGELPFTGVRRYRLIANTGTGLTLQQLNLATGSIWRDYRTGLPNGTWFHRSNFYSIRMFALDGSSTYFYGALSAWRVGASGTTGGVYTVDRVSLDHYTAGVTPREMPASWRIAAVHAQAIAARTYGRYNVEHPLSSRYDICDTTQCQVYGGHGHVSPGGTVLYTDDPDATSVYSNQVLHYAGSTIFSQFSASDGGWTVDGGQPYLVAKADPYDSAASGDPYLLYSRTATTSSLASYFGLKTVTGVAITKRDGHGTWGGRVTNGEVRGTNSSDTPVIVAVSGFDLQYAFGVGSTWLNVV